MSRGSLLFLLFLLFGNVSALNELAGVKLRCCVIEEPPYVVRDYSNTRFEGWNGYSIDYVSKLQERLGFSCSSVRQYDPPIKKDAGFSGFIAAMSECASKGDSTNCICDIGLSAWIHSSERIQLVDMVSPFANEEIVVSTRMSLVNSAAESNTVFITAFSPGVWCAIAALILFHIGVNLLGKVLTLRDEVLAVFPQNTLPAPGNATETSVIPGNSGDQSSTHLLRGYIPAIIPVLLYQIRDVIYKTALLMLGQMPEGEKSVNINRSEGTRRRTRQMALNVVALMMGLFLLVMYQSSVTVQLFDTKYESKFRSLEDIKSCRILPARICVLKGSASEDFWNKALAPQSCIVASTIKPTLVSTFQEGWEQVNSGVCDYTFTLRGITEHAVRGRYCGDLQIVGEPFYMTFVSIILPKDSNLTKTMSVATLRLQEEDKIITLQSDLGMKDKCSSSVVRQLNWDRLKTFFYASFGTLTILAVFMIFDLKYRPCM